MLWECCHDPLAPNPWGTHNLVGVQPNCGSTWVAPSELGKVGLTKKKTLIFSVSRPELNCLKWVWMWVCACVCGCECIFYWNIGISIDDWSHRWRSEDPSRCSLFSKFSETYKTHGTLCGPCLRTVALSAPPLKCFHSDLNTGVRKNHFSGDCHTHHLLAEDERKWNSSLSSIGHSVVFM